MVLTTYELFPDGGEQHHIVNGGYCTFKHAEHAVKSKSEKHQKKENRPERCDGELDYGLRERDERQTSPGCRLQNNDWNIKS